jgi:hypothetical protein
MSGALQRHADREARARRQEITEKPSKGAPTWRIRKMSSVYSRPTAKIACSDAVKMGLSIDFVN